MPSLPVPDILNRLAHARAAGIECPKSVADRQEMAICLANGYPIRSEQGRMYLEFDHDLLVPAWIADETPCLAWAALQIEGYLETGSTNAEALSRARRGAGSGTVIYAECQSAGKGRHGRPWISPRGNGLYFSLILQPNRPPARWVLLTHVASIALVRTLRELSESAIIPRPLALELKWPNDVLISGKKVAGILLETAAFDGVISAVVLGVGVNTGTAGLPPELSDLATSVSLEAGIQIPRRRLLVRFLYHFQIAYEFFQNGRDAQILDEWKNLSHMWKDTAVWILQNGERRPAVTAGLTDTGALRVRNFVGDEEVILAGEVSIRRSDSEEK